MDYAQILTRRFNGSEWVLNGDTYEGLTWLSDSKKPTKTELDKLWPAVETEIAEEKLAKENARLSAIAKLEALGLTVEEVQVAFGLSAE